MNLRQISELLPKNRLFDILFCWLQFLYHSRRLPSRRSGLVTDHFFYLKRSDELGKEKYRRLTDKIDAKEIVREKVGRVCFPKTLAIFDEAAQVSEASLPERCIVKPAHLSGNYTFIDKAKSTPTAADIETIRGWLTLNHYSRLRELNYRSLKPRIICEEMICEPGDSIEFKVWCRRGVPRAVLYIEAITMGNRQSFYALPWQYLNLDMKFEKANPIEPPPFLDEVLQISGRLSADFDFARIDFLTSGDAYYVGEVTFCPDSAITKFNNLPDEKVLGRLLDF